MATNTSETANCPGCDEVNSATNRFCIQCGARMVRSMPADAPKEIWRRFVTGAMATALWAFGLWGLATANEPEDPDQWEIGPDPGVEGVFLLIVLPLWIIASLFGVATVMEFGHRRRVVIGIASGLLAVPVAVALALIEPVDSDFGVAPFAVGPYVTAGLLYASTPFGAGYLAYLLAR